MEITIKRNYLELRNWMELGHSKKQIPNFLHLLKLKLQNYQNDTKSALQRSKATK